MAKNAPYAAGDRIRLLHSDAQGGTVLATIRIERVVRLNDGRWRVEAQRVGGGSVHVLVDDSGHDRDGYVS